MDSKSISQSPSTGIVVALVTLCGTAVVAASLPNVIEGPTMMTNYMGVLGSNQPWNVILFMGIPVLLAEVIAISELKVLFDQGKVPSYVRSLNRWAGILLGPWFFCIFVYLMKNAVVPLTIGGAWHGLVDVIAVGSYLSSVFPLVGIFLLELGVLGQGTARDRMLLHATFVGIFLIVVHIAMVFGMFDPQKFGWCPPNVHECMPGMDM